MNPRVLVVEDNPITLKMLALALRTAEFEVMPAADGESALALARAQAPDLVIQDLVLPDMDGFELLRRLRQVPGGETTPVLALSGFLARMDEARNRDLGYTAFVAKPIEPSRLVDIVRRCLPELPRVARQSGPRRRVLVVDDDPAGRKLLAMQLSLLGFDVEEHPSAGAALVRAREGGVHAVLADLVMPLMDGYELCAALRRDPRTSALPVVLYSALMAEAEDRDEALRVGATALLDRGAPADVLLHAIAAPARKAQAPRRSLPRLRERLADAATRIAHLERRAALHRAELALLGSVADAVTTTQTLPEALQGVLARCMSAAGAARGLIALQRPAGGLEVAAAHGFAAVDRVVLDRLLARLEAESLVGPLLVGAAAGEGPEHELMAHLEAGAALIAPIPVHAGPVGVLALFGRTGEFDLDWEDFARAVAAQVGQVITLVRAFGERLAAEAALREVSGRLEHVFASSPAVTYVLRPAGATHEVVWVSDNIERLQGSPAHEVLQPGWWEARVHPDDLASAMDFAELFSTGEQRRQYRVRGETGSYRWVSDRQRLVRRDGGPVEIVGTWVDVSHQVAAEEARRASDERYRQVFEANPLPMWVYEPGTLRLLEVNAAVVAEYGYSREELLTMTLADLRPTEELQALQRQLAIKPHGESRWLARHRRKDGSVFEVEVSGNDVVYAGRPARLTLVQDVTERRTLEDQLRHAQKMEDIGRLAGGVAHDFNNLLSVITGRAELLRARLPAGQALDAGLSEILDTAGRAADLTRQLLAFSRKQVMRLEPIDLALAVEQTARLLRRLIGEDVQLEIDLREGAGTVLADAGQLSQVLVNLAVNARDAMPEGGRLSIVGCRLERDAGWCASHPGTHPGLHACLEIADTGHGIPAELLPRIFEPFFTTKEPGRGTGLGLAMAYGVMAQHGGAIEVDSQPGLGTTFRLYLPSFVGPASAPAPAPRNPPVAGGSETVLLVEDDPALRELIQEVLVEAGYAVQVAAHAEQALAVNSRSSPDVLVTDVVMPGLSGLELARRLRERRPGLHVLFISGYSGDALAGRDGLEAGVRLLEKPFTPEALLRALRAALDEA
ncbi:MAG: response regulator [Vicinamibacteria bacterium]|nr:response regulator [Vicinamibacteria bacterium]